MIDGSVFSSASGVSGFSNDAVSFPLLAFLVPPTILLHVSPTFAVKTVSNKVLCGIGAVLAFVFVLLISVVFALLGFTLAFTFLVTLALTYPLPPLPKNERSMGTISLAAVFACARQ